jgi:hypothetical protein
VIFITAKFRVLPEYADSWPEIAGVGAHAGGRKAGRQQRDGEGQRRSGLAWAENGGKVTVRNGAG